MSVNQPSSSQSSVKRANNRVGGESSETFSRTDALEIALKDQYEVSDRIWVSNDHQEQKLPLEEIFRWDEIF